MNVRLSFQEFKYKQIIRKLEIENRSHYALESYYDQVLDAMAITLKQRVLAQELDTKVIYRRKDAFAYVPATWWDHFKYTYRNKWWMPKFFKKWNTKKISIPVHFRVKVTPKYLFPEATIPYFGLGKEVKFVDITWE